MALGEDVGVKVSLGVGAPRRQVAQLAALHRGQRVDRQGQRGLGERRLHVGEVEAVRVLPVELEDFIAGVETCRGQSIAAVLVLWKRCTVTVTTGENFIFQCHYQLSAPAASTLESSESCGEPTFAARQLHSSGESEGGRPAGGSVDGIIVINTGRETKVSARNLPQATDHKHALEPLQKKRESRPAGGFERFTLF